MYIKKKNQIITKEIDQVFFFFHFITELWNEKQNKKLRRKKKREKDLTIYMGFMLSFQKSSHSKNWITDLTQIPSFKRPSIAGTNRKRHFPNKSPS